MGANVISAGLPISLSGQYALQGRQCRAGLECYARWANEMGGIFLKDAGRALPLQLKVYDDGSDAVTARMLAERLIQEEGVDLLFGPYGSSLTLAVAAVAERHRRVLWNHSGASDALYAGASSWTVSVLTPASSYFCSLLDLIRRRKPSRCFMPPPALPPP
jgi:branched-chain amino acid transport system substrate-binding protein